MEVKNSTEIVDNTQAVVTAQDSAAATATDDNVVSETSDAFGEFMRNALGGESKAQANEEELFAALIGQRLRVNNPEAADFYEEQKAGYLNSLRRADGYVSVEESAAKALEATLAAGKIDVETAEKVNAEAFAAAQLDDNLTALFDGQGSGNDPTIAVADMEAALLSARTTIDKFDSGELEAGARGLDSPLTTTAGGSSGSAASGGPAPEGTQSLDGSGGFLWKPVSESNGNLVVLLPTSFKGLIDKVEIHSSVPADASTLIEKGRFSGDTHNGGRPHFRFDQPGSGYGSNVHLVVTQDDGTTSSWAIGDGSDRHD